MTDGSGDQLVNPADGCETVGEYVDLALRHGGRRHLDADAVTRRGPRTDQEPGASASAAGRAEHCRRHLRCRQCRTAVQGVRERSVPVSARRSDTAAVRVEAGVDEGHRAVTT